MTHCCHSTYPVLHEKQYRTTWFRAKPYRSSPQCSFHLGELKHWIHSPVSVDVTTFRDRAQEQTTAVIEGFQFLQDLSRSHAEVFAAQDLISRLELVMPWLQKVDSVEYWPRMQKTVRKEDPVLIQRHVKGRRDERNVVEYHASDGHGSSQVLKRHPVLDNLVKLVQQKSGGKVISSLTAVLVSRVYYVTLVTLSPAPHDHVCLEEADSVDGPAHSTRLTPTAPCPAFGQVSLEHYHPSATEGPMSQAVQCTEGPDGSVIPRCSSGTYLTPDAPPPEYEAPPPYSSEGDRLHGLPAYQPHDPPPAYQP